MRSLVFETTASNSGWKIGAFIRLKNLFDIELFMLTCRHYIIEIFLNSVHKELFGATSGPENTNFVEFRESIWLTINIKASFKTLEMKERSFKLTKKHSVESLKRIHSILIKRTCYLMLLIRSVLR